MASVPNGVETNFNLLSRAHERYRQTDRRQTDGREMTYSESEREREFTFAKNVAISNALPLEATPFASRSQL